MLTKCLEDLESRIDEATEGQLYAEWVDFTEDRFEGEIFSPRRATSSEPGVEWPDVRTNESLDDFDLMALQQFRNCSGALEDGGGVLMCVRSNYGTGILPSLFGAELFIMPEETNTLPTTRPIADVEKIEALVDAGVPDVTASLAGRTLEMGERYAAIAAKYPKIGKHVHVYHPDTQGPMDIVEMLWGSGVFLDLIDKPGLVRALLDLVTETYIGFMRKWEAVIPFDDGQQVHWGMHKGTIMLRDDSGMNLSPAMCDEFMLPYDQRLLDEFGGGAIHFCGRGDHYIENMCRLRGMHAIAMSQPEYNDMEVIYRNTVDRGIKLVGFPRWAAEEALASGRDLHGQVQC